MGETLHLLVFARRKEHPNNVILSYNENLQLAGQLPLDEGDKNDDDNDHCDND